MIAGVFLVSMDFTHVKTALHLKRFIFQQILAKVGAVVYEYYKNAFVERCEKETFKAYEFASRQAKGKAKRGAWRIPEKALLSLSFFGGAVGGYLAMHFVRHKTKKWYFHFVNLLGLAWQALLLVYLIKNPNIF